MQTVFQYYNRVQSARGSFTSLPPFARLIVFIFALPGILIAVLSLLGFMVSILALLLLTVPVYRLLQAVSGGQRPLGPTDSTGSLFDPNPSPGRKQVDVRVVE